MNFDTLLNPPLRRRAPMLLAVAALLMLVMLGRKDIVTSHEGRVVQTARQMAASGWPWNATPVEVPAVSLQRDAAGLHLRPVAGEPPVRVNPWLVPVLNGQVRLQKPPLPYWCAAALFRIFGVGEGAARFFPALMGTLCVLLVFDLGQRTLGKRGGWYAGLAWVSSYFIIDEFRKAMADPYLACFTLGAVWAWVRLVSRGNDARVERRDTGSRIAIIFFFYICIGLGCLAKGPLVLLHSGIAIAAYQAWYHRRPRGPWTAHLLGIAIAAGIALPWFGYVKSHVPHAADIWRFESIGELSDNDENARPWWFYLPTIFQLSLPWTPVWAIAIWAAVSRSRGSTLTTRTDRATGSDSSGLLQYAPAGPRSRNRNRRMRGLFPLAWYVITLLFFSFVKLKKAAYLLPMMPAQALLIGQGLLFITAACRKPSMRGFGEAMLGIQAFIGIAAAIALPILAFQTFQHRALAALICCSALAVAWIPMARRKRPARWAVAQSLVYALLVAFLVDGFLAEKDNQRSGKPAGQRLAMLLKDPSSGTIPDRIAADVAVYVPLESMKPSNPRRLYLVVDDRRDAAKPDPKAFAPFVTYGRITGVTLLPPPADARRGSKRWKTFEILVEPDSQ